MTWTTTIDESGKIKLPDDLIEKRSIKAGQKVRIVELPNGSLRLKIGRDIMELAGMLDGNGIHLSLGEINNIIARQGREK
ncbi:MAG: hypothetical protein FJY67_09005 [Calditrichaeota bacterium]|nr:hypothetical protein [Calditrichota bacterium]